MGENDIPVGNADYSMALSLEHIVNELVRLNEKLELHNQRLAEIIDYGLIIRQERTLHGHTKAWDTEVRR